MPQGGRFTAPEFGPLLQSLLAQRQMGQQQRQFDVQAEQQERQLGFQETEANQRTELFQMRTKQQGRLNTLADQLLEEDPQKYRSLAEQLYAGKIEALDNLPGAVKARNEALYRQVYFSEALRLIPSKKITGAQSSAIMARAKDDPAGAYAEVLGLEDKPAISKEQAQFEALRDDPEYAAYWVGQRYDTFDFTQREAMKNAGLTRYDFIIDEMSRLGHSEAVIAGVMKIPPAEEQPAAGPSPFAGLPEAFGKLGGVGTLAQIAARVPTMGPIAPVPVIGGRLVSNLIKGLVQRGQQAPPPGLPGQPNIAAPMGENITGLGIPQPTQAAQDTTGAPGGAQQILALLMALLTKQRGAQPAIPDTTQGLIQ